MEKHFTVLFRQTRGKQNLKETHSREISGFKDHVSLVPTLPLTPKECFGHRQVPLRSSHNTKSISLLTSALSCVQACNFLSCMCAHTQIPTHISTPWKPTPSHQCRLRHSYNNSISSSPAKHPWVSVPQAASSVGESSLPFQVARLAALLSSIVPSLPARVWHHHFIWQCVERMVHYLHLHRVVRWQVPQSCWEKEQPVTTTAFFFFLL